MRSKNLAADILLIRQENRLKSEKIILAYKLL